MKEEVRAKILAGLLTILLLAICLAVIIILSDTQSLFAVNFQLHPMGYHSGSYSFVLGSSASEPTDLHRTFKTTVVATPRFLPIVPEQSLPIEDYWSPTDKRRTIEKDPCPRDKPNIIDDDLYWFKDGFSTNYDFSHLELQYWEVPYVTLPTPSLLRLLFLKNGDKAAVAYGYYPDDKGTGRYAVCIGTDLIGPFVRSEIQSRLFLIHTEPMYKPSPFTVDITKGNPRIDWLLPTNHKATKLVIYRRNLDTQDIDVEFNDITNRPWVDTSADCGEYEYWIASASDYKPSSPADLEAFEEDYKDYGAHSDWAGPRLIKASNCAPTNPPVSEDPPATPSRCLENPNQRGVILYSEPGYFGHCVHRTTSYPDLLNLGFGSNNVSSIRINGKYRVRLFSGTNYQPEPYEEINQSEGNIDIRSLGGRYKSIEIVEQQDCDENISGVLLYADRNFHGTCIHLLTSHSNLGSTVVGDDEVSSIRINGEYTVNLYKEINFGGGNPEEVNKSDPDLDKRSLGGQYSSVRIESPAHCENENLPGVYLYSEEDHDGNCAHITGDVANLDDTPVGNDGPRSLRIVGPYYIVMYKDRGFSGPSDEFGDNQDDLTWRSLGDQYSSVRFYEKNKPPVLSLNAANSTNITSNNQEVWSSVADWTFSGIASDSDGSVSRVEFNCEGDVCRGRNFRTEGTTAWYYHLENATGYNRIYFFAYDDDGARNSEQDRSVINLYIDQAAPTTTASLNSESNQEHWLDYWFTQPVQVRLDAQDGASGRARRGVAEVFYSLDSGPWQQVTGSSATFPVNGDGSHQVDFYAVDGVGNREAAQSVTFHIDQTPPSPPGGVAETHSTPHNRWQRDVDTPTFTWNPSSDAASGVWGYQFYFDTDPTGIGYQTFLAGDQLLWTPRPDGVRTATYYLRGRSRDVAGNWSAWVDLFTFRYDGTPPENPDAASHAAGVTNDSWQRVTALADFTWAEPHDEGSGVNGYFAYWGSDPAGTADTFTTERAFQSGAPLCATDSACSGYLRLRSVDNVQNQAEDWSTAFTLRYDNAPPTVDFTFNGGVTQTTQTQITLDILAADLGSGVKEMRFSSDGQSWTEWEVHRPTRAWTIPGISRKDWPIYV